MAVREQLDTSSDTMESDLYYNCVDDPAVADEAQLDARLNPTLSSS